MPYTHLTADQRVALAALLRAERNQTAVAKQFGKHRSTISRELARNRLADGRYFARVAQEATKARHRRANGLRRKLVPGNELADSVEEKIRRFWSPEQVAGRLRREAGSPAVCPETIYQYIYRCRPELKDCLRCRKGRYRRRYGTKIRENRREETKKKRIDIRPAVVGERSRIGDWEGDTIVGQEKTAHVLTHTERKSGKLLADKVANATAERVRLAARRRLERLPRKKRLTITYDNGIQFAEHETLERDLMTPIYFAHPYHSWERGTSENTNGLLRQFLPKGSSFAALTQRKLDRFVKLINTRPRKRHDYLTPDEVFRCCTST